MVPPTTSTRGQGQPVWILVAVLLAVIVAVTMYRLVTRLDVDELPDMDSETATTRFTQQCQQWRDMDWNQYSKPKAKEARHSLELYAWRANQILSKEEVEAGKQVQPCDCIVYLHMRNLIDYGETIQLWKQHKECNSWAKNTGCSKNFCGTAAAASECKKAHACPT